MAITTYAELQTAVGSWLNRSDLTSTIPDFIRLGELRIFREARVQEMEETLSGTISSGVLALPTGYMDLKFAYINATPTSILQRSTAQQIYAQYPTRSGQGKPAMIAREGSNFIFGPYPDAGYTVTGVYYKTPTSIASTENDVFLAYPDLYLFAALVESSPKLRDNEQIQVWEAKYQQILRQANQVETREQSSGSGLTVITA